MMDSDTSTATDRHVATFTTDAELFADTTADKRGHRAPLAETRSQRVLRRLMTVGAPLL